jgi:hypothetical protein
MKMIEHRTFNIEHRMFNEQKARPRFHSTFDVRCWMFNVLFLLFICSPAFAQDKFTLHPDHLIGPPIVGFGAEMNPYLYCTPNKITEAQAKSFEQRVIDLGPQHVRIFMLLDWFTARADPISKGDPRTADSFIRTCRLAQTAGATINVTLWYGMRNDPAKQMADFALVLQRLIKQEKLTAIRYVTLQNEPNLHDFPKDTYTTLYRALDANLKKLGLRDHLKIISGDLVSNNQQEWVAILGTSLASVSDGYSIHAYWDYWDTPKLQRRLRESQEMFDALPANQRRPLYVMEFGVRGHRAQEKIEPGDDDAGKPIADNPLQANQLGWFMIDGMNRGYVAFVIWTLEDAWYDRLMPYGVIGSVQNDWPPKPGYHLLRLLTHTIKPGWRAIKVDASAHSGAAPNSEDGAVVSAATDGKGGLTILALNTTDQPRKISLAGLPSHAFHQWIWNQDADGKTRPGESPKPDSAGAAAIALPARGMIVLTTMRVDPPADAR